MKFLQNVADPLQFPTLFSCFCNLFRYEYNDH